MLKPEKSRFMYVKTCVKIIDYYITNGGGFDQVCDGCMGLGLIVLTGLEKDVVIKEVVRNEWSSSHVVEIWKKGTLNQKRLASA